MGGGGKLGIVLYGGEELEFGGIGWLLLIIGKLLLLLLLLGVLLLLLLGVLLSIWLSNREEWSISR